MERVIEIFFDQFLKEILGEGERRFKLHAFSACLEAIRGIRRLFIVVYLLCFACFLSALSFFATGYLAVEQWKSSEPDWLDARLLFCAAVWIVSTGLLALTVRESKWSGAFGLKEKIAALEYEASSSRGSFGSSGGNGLSEADLVRVINRVLDERLKSQTEPVSEPVSEKEPEHVG
jgi:hypothetical protein